MSQAQRDKLVLLALVLSLLPIKHYHFQFKIDPLQKFGFGLKTVTMLLDPQSLQCFKTPAGGALTWSCSTNMTAWELPPSQYSAPVLVSTVGSYRKNSCLPRAFVSFAFHHRLPIQGVCAQDIIMHTWIPHPRALCQGWDGDKQIRLVICVITLWFMARLGFCSHHLLWSGW